MSTDNLSPHFGCPHCMPGSANAAWQARCSFPRICELIDESHYHVMVLNCPQCAQQFVSVFTETVDWIDGEDPQYWTLLPVTIGESRMLIEQSGQLTVATLNSLAPERRSLTRARPKGEEARCSWGFGMWVRPHD